MSNWLQQKTLRDAYAAWAKHSAEEQWKLFLTGQDPALRRYRHILRFLPADIRCKFCNAPLEGSGAPLMRMIGRGPSRLNPTFCKVCIETIPVGGAEVELTMFFADVRGSTKLAEQMSAFEFSQLMNRFYRTAVDSFTRTDALINRLIGDAVIGLYIGGLSGPDHAQLAVAAGKELLRALGYSSQSGPWLPVGIGIHTGISYVGKVGDRNVDDFAVLGDAANITARLASCAAPGQILISESAVAAACLEKQRLQHEQIVPKGRTGPISVYVIESERNT